MLYAALHAPRELWLAPSAVKAIVGQRLFPRLLDRYLGRVGYEKQQTGEPERRREDDLFAPLPGDRGAHGRFEARSRRFSLEVWARTHPAAVASAGALALAAAGWRALAR